MKNIPQYKRVLLLKFRLDEFLADELFDIIEEFREGNCKDISWKIEPYGVYEDTEKCIAIFGTILNPEYEEYQKRLDVIKKIKNVLSPEEFALLGLNVDHSNQEQAESFKNYKR